MNKPAVEVGQCWTSIDANNIPAGLRIDADNMPAVLCIIRKNKNGTYKCLYAFEYPAMFKMPKHLRIEYLYRNFLGETIHNKYEYNDLAFLVRYGSPQEVLASLLSTLQKKHRSTIRTCKAVIKKLEAAKAASRKE